jgi:hypothetical protein
MERLYHMPPAEQALALERLLARIPNATTTFISGPIAGGERYFYEGRLCGILETNGMKFVDAHASNTNEAYALSLPKTTSRFLAAAIRELMRAVTHFRSNSAKAPRCVISWPSAVRRDGVCRRHRFGRSHRNICDLQSIQRRRGGTHEKASSIRAPRSMAEQARLSGRPGPPRAFQVRFPLRHP